jgi:hypothetical protein
MQTLFFQLKIIKFIELIASLIRRGLMPFYVELLIVETGQVSTTWNCQFYTKNNVKNDMIN